LITVWIGREQDWGSSHEEIDNDNPRSESDSIRHTSKQVKERLDPEELGKSGDSDSGSSNAEKYAGNPVKQYTRALRRRGKNSLTLHSAVTPQEGRLAYQGEKGMVGGGSCDDGVRLWQVETSEGEELGEV
jgi:hypothetical protein